MGKLLDASGWSKMKIYLKVLIFLEFLVFIELRKRS